MGGRSKRENEEGLPEGGCGRAEGERLTRHHCAASPLLSESDSHLSRTNRSLISQMEPNKYPSDATPRGARIFFFCFLSARAMCNLIAEGSTEGSPRPRPSHMEPSSDCYHLGIRSMFENFDDQASAIRVSLLSRPETAGGC